MIHPALSPTLLVALLAPTASLADDPPRAGRVRIAQVTIRERIIIRIPRLPGPIPAGRTPIPAGRAAIPSGRTVMPVPVVYRESKGPSCVMVATMAGAAIGNANVVDLVLTGGKRLRARLDEDCAPMDFRSGFYLRPAADGRVCAGRDPIRVRSGASCLITRFRTLTPKR